MGTGAGGGGPPSVREVWLVMEACLEEGAWLVMEACLELMIRESSVLKRRLHHILVVSITQQCRYLFLFSRRHDHTHKMTTPTRVMARTALSAPSVPPTAEQESDPSPSSSSSVLSSPPTTHVEQVGQGGHVAGVAHVAGMLHVTGNTVVGQTSHDSHVAVVSHVAGNTVVGQTSQDSQVAGSVCGHFGVSPRAASGRPHAR